MNESSKIAFIYSKLLTKKSAFCNYLSQMLPCDMLHIRSYSSLLH